MTENPTGPLQNGTSPTPSTDADATRKDTRGRILEASIIEFSMHGPSGANTARIVARAGCNIRMLYHYFGNKDGLYRAALVQVYADLRAAEQQAHFWSLPPREALVGLTRFTYDYMSATPAFPRMILAENLAGGDTIRQLDAPFTGSRALIARIDALLDAGHTSGAFAHSPSALDLYLTILALAFIHISNRHTLGITFGVDLGAADFVAARRAQCVQAALGYVGAEPGQPDL